MYDSEINNIANILKKILGNPKDEYSYDNWSHWNCPCCAEHKGVESDNKYNLEINIRKNRFHCWVCGETDQMKGKLSKLIKRYGSYDILNEYKSEILNIKQSKLYDIFSNETDFDENFIIEQDIELPYGFKNFNGTENEALKYLRKRGIDDFLIEKYNIGYIDNSYNKDISLKERIIVPSYDNFNDLNYWVGRDYTNKSFMRYKNPLLPKKSFIFNEGLINWYEDITLVEGVFDHIVVPNSIPLLGKTLDKDYYLYEVLRQRAKSNINILLDDDAKSSAIKIYRLLYNTNLKEQIRIIDSPDGYDASLMYEKFGKKGIIELLKRSYKISEYDLNSMNL